MRALIAVMLLAASPALAQERTVTLKDGPARATVETNCGACHSLDYIPMNAPFPDAKLWEAEIQKMIKAFGAPVDDADAKAILDYLVKNYGS